MTNYYGFAIWFTKANDEQNFSCHSELGEYESADKAYDDLWKKCEEVKSHKIHMGDMVRPEMTTFHIQKTNMKPITNKK